MWLGNKQQTECQHPSLVTGFFMGGFVPACHTQTFVEVAKLEFYMTYSLVFIFIGYLIYAWWPEKGEESHRYGRLRWVETKRLGGHGAKCIVCANGRVEAVIYTMGKGGRNITLECFESLNFHKQRGGEWVRKNYHPDGSLKEVIDLMPTLNLPPPPMEPAQIPRRSYGRFL